MYTLFQIRFIGRFYSSFSNAAINIPNEIKLPKKIYRDDFTVLKALSSCIKIEPGTPEFSAIDDPFTIPREYLKRYKFALSKASGKLSARMAFKEMKQDFIRVANDDPPVKNLMPLFDPNEIERAVKMNRLSVEDGLKKLVRLLSPTNAWSFYEAHKDTQFSDDTLLSLLELLCATGSLEPDFEKPPEELYFAEGRTLEWDMDGPAELLFAQLTSKSVAEYCAIIRGAAKHNHPARAIEHMRQMQLHYPDGSMNLATVNELLRSLSVSEAGDVSVGELVVELLKGLARAKVPPTTHTFNNAIFAFVRRDSLDFVESIYSEMIAAGLEPTLGTYSILLQCQFLRGELMALTTDIISLLEERCAWIVYEETTSNDDRTLFMTIMALCRRMKRVDLALRLNAVVDEAGGRFQMFTNQTCRNRYFESFIKLLTASEKIDLGKVVATIAKYVPKFNVLQPSTINHLVGRAASANDLRIVTRIIDLANWTHLRHVESDSFQRILQLLGTADFHDGELCAMIRESLWKVFEYSQSREQSVLKVNGIVDALIDIIGRAGGGVTVAKDTFLWSLIDYGKERHCLRVTTVRAVMAQCVREHDYDHVLHLWRCLVECVTHQHRSTATQEPERAALSSLVEEAEAVVLPTLDKCSLHLTEASHCVDRCKAWLADTV